MLRVPSRPSLYNTEWSSFPGLKEGQRYRNTTRRSASNSAQAGRTCHPTPQLQRDGLRAEQTGGHALVQLTSFFLSSTIR
ncbi:hypothetical protein ILYODFUR_010765 [Ilyodon furcidens]|uniref:Uncharacterized protein n=1 Tax=Ilyodon furcidens TaxID=33524 RepID=A0ABV0T9T1_9TELE